MPTICELKYCMINYTFPIVFITPFHKDMEVHGKITSAGFLKIHHSDKIYVETYGRSTSLDMKPHKDDARILEHFLGLSK